MFAFTSTSTGSTRSPIVIVADIRRGSNVLSRATDVSQGLNSFPLKNWELRYWLFLSRATKLWCAHAVPLVIHLAIANVGESQRRIACDGRATHKDITTLLCWPCLERCIARFLFFLPNHHCKQSNRQTHRQSG